MPFLVVRVSRKQHGGGGGDRDASFPEVEIVQELTHGDRLRSQGQHRRGQHGTPRGLGGIGSSAWRKGSDEDPVRCVGRIELEPEEVY